MVLHDLQSSAFVAEFKRELRVLCKLCLALPPGEDETSVEDLLAGVSVSYLKINPRSTLLQTDIQLVKPQNVAGACLC